jgi:hypothetical protein
MTKSSAKTARRKTRHSQRKTAAKNAKKVSRKVAAESVPTQRKLELPLEPIRSSGVQDAFRGLAERNVAQTRELYDHSKSTLQAMLESWQRSFGAAGQGVVALNRRIVDVADRNINNNFDFATALAGAKHLAEIMELHASYWRKQFAADTSGELRSSPKRRN